MTSDYLIGPYFFDGPVNTASHLAMLEKWFQPQLRDSRLMDDVWPQHNGAHIHFALSVHDVLKEHFPSCQNDHGPPKSVAPFTWPPCSPDLTTPNNSLWVVSRE